MDRSPLLGDEEAGGASGFMPARGVVVSEAPVSKGASSTTWKAPKVTSEVKAIIILIILSAVAFEIVWSCFPHSTTTGLVELFVVPLFLLSSAKILEVMFSRSAAHEAETAAATTGSSSSAQVLSTFQLVVPEGVGSGQVIRMKVPNAEVQVQVPDNAVPGTKLEVKVALAPPATNAWSGKHSSSVLDRDHLRDEAQMELALQTWIETSQDAAEAAIFSPMGMWVSPGAVVMLVVLGGLFAIYFLTSGLFQTWMGTAYFFDAVTMLGTAALVRSGRREQGKKMWFFGFAVAAVFYIASATAPKEVVNTRGYKYDPKNNFAWAWASTWMAVAVLAAACTASWPHKTFELLFVCVPIAQTAGYFAYTFTGDLALYASDYFVPLLASIGFYMWLGKQRAEATATCLCDKDAQKYEDLWSGLLKEQRFVQALAKLRESWDYAQAGAISAPKSQQGVSSLCALFVQADELNDLLGAKLFELARMHGGIFQSSQVKKTSRALQKVFRSYRGDWRKLCDLCRCSIVFANVSAMAACLRAIGDDAELTLLKTADEKMRLREGYDARKLSGGYRDVQLCVRLGSAAARARGLQMHLAEVQLHLDSVLELKKQGGGHKNYVKARNMKGS